jgi:hypothetical protein
VGYSSLAPRFRPVRDRLPAEPTHSVQAPGIHANPLQHRWVVREASRVLSRSPLCPTFASPREATKEEIRFARFARGHDEGSPPSGTPCFRMSGVPSTWSTRTA